MLALLTYLFIAVIESNSIKLDIKTLFVIIFFMITIELSFIQLSMFSSMTYREYENISHFMLFYYNQNTIDHVESNTYNV